MPYQKVELLPESVKDALPEHGQEIFKEAYNSAWAEYADAEDRRGDDTQEEVAMKVAWSAVKQVYEKNDHGEWVEKG